MNGPRVKSKPSAYVITIDGKVVEDAGKGGLIKSERVAVRLRELLEIARPDSDVLMFGYYELTGAR